MKDKGYLWWKEIWISICSMHFTPDEDCNLCQKGKYYNDWKVKLIAFWWDITNKKY